MELKSAEGQKGKMALKHKMLASYIPILDWRSWSLWQSWCVLYTMVRTGNISVRYYLREIIPVITESSISVIENWLACKKVFGVWVDPDCVRMVSFTDTRYSKHVRNVHFQSHCWKVKITLHLIPQKCWLLCCYALALCCCSDAFALVYIGLTWLCKAGC